MASPDRKRQASPPKARQEEPTETPAAEQGEGRTKVKWFEGEDNAEEPWHADWDLGPEDEEEGEEEDLFADDEEVSGFDDEERDDEEEDDEAEGEEAKDRAEEDDDFAFDDEDDDDDDDEDGEDGPPRKKKAAVKPKRGAPTRGASDPESGGGLDAAAAPWSAEEGPVGDPAESESVSDDAEGVEGNGDKRRGRRRSKTIARKQMLRERRRMLALGTIPEVVDYERPHTRAECRQGERPCLYVSCRYHLYLDVNPVTGSIKLNFPDKEVWQLADTCALDVAERGGITLEEVGEIMNLTRERIRQVEVSGLDKLKRGDVSLKTFLDGRELDVGAAIKSDDLDRDESVLEP